MIRTLFKGLLLKIHQQKILKSLQNIFFYLGNITVEVAPGLDGVDGHVDDEPLGHDDHLHHHHEEQRQKLVHLVININNGLVYMDIKKLTSNTCQ